MDLGDTNRTFSQDLAYVRAMDASRPTVVLIGVNLGRFTQAPSPTLADKPLTGEEQAGIDGTIDLKHRYSVDDILSDDEKRAMIDKWLTKRYPLFRRNHEENRAMLAELVEASQERGFYPVLVDLPLNLEIADGRLDEPREVYLEDSRTVADKLGSRCSPSSKPSASRTASSTTSRTWWSPGARSGRRGSRARS